LNAHAIPLVTLHQALPRRARRSNLAPLDFWLGAGLHALVGTPADGTLAIAKLLGGVEPSASGQVIVAGRDPGRDPPLRARIGVTLDTPRLPAAHLVRDLLEEVDLLRGGRGAAAMGLERLGLSQWSARKMTGLSRRELRALDLVIATTTSEPIALVLTEPGADIAPVNRQALRETLARAAEAGACVLVITASMSDAVELADTVHVLERGRIVRWVPVGETGALVPGRGIELRVEVDLPRLLVASLADDPAVIGIDWDQHGHRSVLSVRGDDLDQIALAVARAATSAGASVRSIAPVAPGLDEVRAAASGLALAAYHAAYRTYLEQDARSRAAGDA
jgi:ABC-type multidrug transport system ATPase subunit